ncbi:DUF397 domain-containing protein [Amycolatopsis cihanbeyliensis]|uniref:Uncharacterized protein DUF397 n=1 Tax=Amycolatopsis cihanbeyliensis TaxID=1128664 RepID=A0A542DQ04_AMYCI|nr:DUF397 domain-containing protein [Amycolatopsis cihanbeyliensis]TQJ05172.1 uncharacterized protein DUF397 [Amycolatopsis cihanbeyliensis]
MASERQWSKSSRSSTGTNCVEIALPDGAHRHVGVRDTKDRTGGTLLLSASAWRAFTRQVRAAS